MLNLIGERDPAIEVKGSWGGVDVENDNESLSILEEVGASIVRGLGGGGWGLTTLANIKS